MDLFAPALLNPFFIFGAKYAVILPATLAALYFLVQPRPIQKKMFLFGLATALVSLAVMLLLGALVDNPRPFVTEHSIPLIAHDPTNGMPSHHTLLCAVLAAILTPFSARLATMLWILAIWVGYARIYVGVHHGIDIIASFLIAVVVGGGLHLFLRNRHSSAILPAR